MKTFPSGLMQTWHFSHPKVQTKGWCHIFQNTIFYTHLAAQEMPTGMQENGKQSQVSAGYTGNCHVLSCSLLPYREMMLFLDISPLIWFQPSKEKLLGCESVMFYIAVVLLLWKQWDTPLGAHADCNLLAGQSFESWSYLKKKIKIMPCLSREFA